MRSHPPPTEARVHPRENEKRPWGNVPLQMECKILNCVCVCACVCICRSSWELRRSVSTTTKVPTKGFPISFNGALIATPTEGMEQPDEKGWREGPVTGAGGEKREGGRGIRRDNPGSKRFSIDDGATDSLRSFHRVPIIDTLASSWRGFAARQFLSSVMKWR